MICKICKYASNFIFKGLVLNKYQVDYFKCPNCDFIQTEKPYWLDEAYNNAITDLDVGLVSRNLNYSNLLEKIIKNSFDYKGKFLDYAGGYGLFVRLMRDKGFDFYREDKYCKNIFAQYNDFNVLEEDSNFEVVTAFELFEHMEDPLLEINNLFKYSDTVIFSTELQPNIKITNSDDWWYFTPETGQHIAFYTEKTFQCIAEKLKYTFNSLGNLHLLSQRKFEGNPLLIDGMDYNIDNIKLNSLIQDDFELAKNISVKSINAERNIDTVENDIGKNDYLISKLSVSNAKLDLLDTKLKNTNTELNLTKSQLDLTNIELNQTKSQLDLTNIELNQTKSQLDSRNSELNLTKTQLDLRVSELTSIYYSRGWKLIVFLRRIANSIPGVVLRRKAISFIYNFLKQLVKIILIIKGGIKAGLLNLKNYFIHLKPRNKRKINISSKKIVYVGHSFHDKTKSTVFLIDYLKKFFEVEVVLDESWNGKPFPDLSFIDESYLGVIFFQLLPSKNIIQYIKNDNIIHFPMYDQSGRLGLDYWNNIRNLKIINFSKTLHNKLTKWGLDSMYIQYFPKPDVFIPGHKDEIFFWQRLSQININTIVRLFNKDNFKIHLHKTVDPGQEFIQPDEDIVSKFQMTFSDWYKTREEMWDVIKQKGIYVAPREYEGIGMSFLEAMSMGKAVIAVDNPTMNEYIINGETGYLFDLKNPNEIDLTSIVQVQKNCYEFMCAGYKKWEEDKEKIINFIKKN